jgi:hypothetical protein
MKKFVIVSILFIGVFASGKAQNVFTADHLVANDSITVGDSTATGIHSGILIDEQYFQENALQTNAPHVDFDTTQTSKTHREGRMWYDDSKKNWVMYNNRPNTSLDVGREGRLRGINVSGGTIGNGDIVIISGDATGIREINYANAKWDSTSIGTIGFATEDIVASDTGEIALWGEINELNTSGISPGSIVYLDTVDGDWSTTAHTSPNWQVFLGNVGRSHATLGSINARVDIRSNIVGVTSIFNGAILESHTVEASSNGTNVYCKLSNGTSALTLFYDSQPNRFSIPDSVLLTAGSDVSPTRNWIYIPKSTKALTVSTSGFPADDQFVPVADILVQSAASAQADGIYKVHAWTDHLTDSVGQGHLSHVNKWIRNQNATWESGVVPTTSIGTNGAAIDTVKFSVTSGQVLQLHSHGYPATNLVGGDHAHVINDETTAYEKINSLGDIDTDTGGNTLRSNNTYYSIVMWGSISEDDFDCQMFANKPTGFYGTSAGAIADASNYSVYTIPDQYRGTGFLIARVTLRYQTLASGTFIVEQVDDLRGLLPATGAGGGAVSPSSGNFADNAFTIFNITDNTKVIDFDASQLTTSTTRTITMPDRDITLIDSVDVENTTFSSLSANDSVDVGPHVIRDDTPGLEIEAEGGDEYFRLWDAAGTASIGATTSISLNPGIEGYTFDEDSAYNSANRRFAYIDEAGGGTAAEDIVDQSILTQDTLYQKLYKSENLDTVAVVPVIIDTLLDDMYLVTINISSANVLAGDSIQLVAAPGSGKAIIPSSYAIIFNANATAYTAGADSYLRTWDEDGTAANLTTTFTAFYLLAISYDGTINFDTSYGDYISSNSPVWYDIGDGFLNGDGTYVLKFWYLIADFN